MSRPNQKRLERKAKLKRERSKREAFRRKMNQEDKNLKAKADTELRLRHKAIKPYDLRVCGECQVCCHVMKIDDTESPKYENCKHQCPSGCDIHETAPKECQHFECTWKLEKLLGEDYRPDRCGFMLYAQAGTHFGRLVLMANGSYEGAWSKPGIHERLAFVAHKLNMLIIKMGKTNIPLGMYGPPIILAKAKAIVEKIRKEE